MAERAVQSARGLAKTLMAQDTQQTQLVFNESCAVWTWALRHAGWLLTRFCKKRSIRMTPCNKLRLHKYRQPIQEFAKAVLSRKPAAVAAQDDMADIETSAKAPPVEGVANASVILIFIFRQQRWISQRHLHERRIPAEPATRLTRSTCTQTSTSFASSVRPFVCLSVCLWQPVVVPVCPSCSLSSLSASLRDLKQYTTCKCPGRLRTNDMQREKRRTTSKNRFQIQSSPVPKLIGTHLCSG